MVMPTVNSQKASLYEKKFRLTIIAAIGFP